MPPVHDRHLELKYGIFLAIAGCAAAALFMLFLANRDYSSWAEEVGQPWSMAFSVVMGIAVYLLWRRRVWAALLYFGALAGIAYFLNTPFNGRGYLQGIGVLNAMCATGAMAMGLALFAQRHLSPSSAYLPLLPHRRSEGPDIVLIAFVILNLLLTFLTSTARGRPFYELLYAGNLAWELLLAAIVLFMQAALVALLLGQAWSIRALRAVIITDAMSALLAMNPIVAALRVVPWMWLSWVVSRNKAYFSQASEAPSPSDGRPTSSASSARSDATASITSSS